VQRHGQNQVLHLLQQAKVSVIILTGDLHYSDIKVFDPSRLSDALAKGKGCYRSLLPDRNETTLWKNSITQAMASGLTAGESAWAIGGGRKCNTMRKDMCAMRVPRVDGTCGIVGESPDEAAFGMLDVYFSAGLERDRPEITRVAVSIVKSTEGGAAAAVSHDVALRAK
jgi:hypothetical protein